MMARFPQLLRASIVGAAGVLGLRSYLSFRQDLRFAQDRVQTNTKVIGTHLGPIVYGSRGEGAPVLVIHGAGGGFDQALHTTRIFGGGFKWIAPSRFGYLGTPLPEDASPQAQADAHAALLDALEIDHAPIIAISAGGPSAIQFALRHPERCTGLVLVSAVSKALIDVASNSDIMLKLINGMLSSDWAIWIGLQLVIRKIVPPMGVPMKVVQKMDETDTAWLKSLLSYVLPIQPRRVGLLNDFFQIYNLDIFPLNQISPPALIIHAQDDSLVSIKQGRFSAKFIPNARLEILPDGGHLLLGQRERLMNEVKPFLEQVCSC